MYCGVLGVPVAPLGARASLCIPLCGPILLKHRARTQNVASRDSALCPFGSLWAAVELPLDPLRCISLSRALVSFAPMLSVL